MSRFLKPMTAPCCEKETRPPKFSFASRRRAASQICHCQEGLDVPHENSQSARKPRKAEKPQKPPDDFVSVARRLGCDEDKGRFEKKLGKIAKARPQAKE